MRGETLMMAVVSSQSMEALLWEVQEKCENMNRDVTS
jgi:hypothetical protein